MELTFVNINGEVVDTASLKRTKRKASSYDKSFHKGFRVVGVSPEQMAYAVREFSVKFPGTAFNEIEFLRNARRKPVRSRPYELRQAADECLELAKKSGWSGLQVIEVMKG